MDMEKLQFKGGILNRVKLVIWFQLMAIWAIFSARVPARVVEFYVKAEQEKIDRGVDQLHK